jgi:hypothetical protein
VPVPKGERRWPPSLAILSLVIANAVNLLGS